jgi:hypothetical protein
MHNKKNPYKPYKHLDIPEDEIKEILEIYESFSDTEKNIFIFYLLYGTDADILAHLFHREELYVMSTIAQALAAFYPIDILHVREVLEIHIRIDIKSPIVVKSSFFQWQWNNFHDRFRPLERVVIALCVMAFLYSSVITGTALYQFGLVRIEREKNAGMYVNSEKKYELETIKVLFLPEYLPDGYKLSEQNGKPYENVLISTFYTHKDTNILFQQTIDNIMMDLDNENVSTKEIKINNNQGIFQEKDSMKMIIWAENNYFFSVSCNNPNVELSELQKIAESLKETCP